MAVSIDPRLVGICERSMPDRVLTAEGITQEDKLDYHLPMGSLPRFLEIVKKILRDKGRLS